MDNIVALLVAMILTAIGMTFALALFVIIVIVAAALLALYIPLRIGGYIYVRWFENGKAPNSD